MSLGERRDEVLLLREEVGNKTLEHFVSLCFSAIKSQRRSH